MNITRGTWPLAAKVTTTAVPSFAELTGRRQPARKMTPPPARSPRQARPGETLYTMILLTEVDRDARKAAARMAQLAAAELGVRPPLVWWVADRDADIGRKARAGGADEVPGPAGASAFYDRNTPNSVYLTLTDSPDEAAHLAAHETYHYWQHRAEGGPLTADVPPDVDRDAYEADAEAFAASMLMRHGTREPWS